MSFYSDSGDERMISLRQRTKSSDGYARLSSDDEVDDLPALNAFKSKVVPRKNSTNCKLKVSLTYNTYNTKLYFIHLLIGASFCSVFSIFGIVFLSIIATLLHNNSIYLKASVKTGQSKSDLVQGVIGAIIMYVVCLGVSIYFLFTGSRTVTVVENPRLDD